MRGTVAKQLRRRAKYEAKEQGDPNASYEIYKDLKKKHKPGVFLEPYFRYPKPS